MWCNEVYLEFIFLLIITHNKINTKNVIFKNHDVWVFKVIFPLCYLSSKTIFLLKAFLRKQRIIWASITNCISKGIGKCISKYLHIHKAYNLYYFIQIFYNMFHSTCETNKSEYDVDGDFISVHIYIRCQNIVTRKTVIICICCAINLFWI